MARYDRAPLQVTQFEADNRLVDQVEKIWVEGGGGGNDNESYSLAHLFAAMKTRTDAAAEGRKGYLFTIGDEPNCAKITVRAAKEKLGIDLERDLTAEEALLMAQRNWHVYHVVLVNEGHCRSHRSDVLGRWRDLMGQSVIELEDVNALAETVVSVMQVNEGALADEVAASWSGSTALVVASALRGVPAKTSAATGLRRLGA